MDDFETCGRPGSEDGIWRLGPQSLYLPRPQGGAKGRADGYGSALTYLREHARRGRRCGHLQLVPSNAGWYHEPISAQRRRSPTLGAF